MGFFASPQAMAVSYGSGGCGIFYAGHDGCTAAGDQLLAQLWFVLAIIAWVGATMFALLFVCKIILGMLDENWIKQGKQPGDEQSTPLAYTKSMQMIGMDEIKHGGMSGTENITVHSPPGSGPAPTSPTSPEKLGVERSRLKQRNSVVGQRVLPADEFELNLPTEAPSEAEPTASA